MTTRDRMPSLRLFDYYVIEGMSAFACTILQLGLYFWARERFGFTNTENLLLGTLHGLGHITGSRFGGRLGDRYGYNRLIIPALVATCLIGLLGWRLDFHAAPFVVMALYAGSIALTWPALEGGAMHLPGAFNMPQRLGIYNLVWSTSGAAGFFLCGWLFAWNHDAVLWCAGLVHMLQLGWIIYQRGRHQPAGATAMALHHRGDEQSPARKKHLVRFSWLANSCGFFLIAGFSALTPHIGEKLGLTQTQTIWLSASLLASRAVGFLLFWRWEGWHYRVLWSHAALWSAPVLLAVIFFASTLAPVVLACLGLGLSLGLSYYQSLYYSLDASDKKGEQGGWHESIIGLGILAGPLVGAAGGAATGTTFGAKTAIIAGALSLAIAGMMLLRRK